MDNNQLKAKSGQEEKQLTVCCIGAGYVGGPSSAVLALNCPHIQVIVCDADANKIQQWHQAANHVVPASPVSDSATTADSGDPQPPIYEPGLLNVLRQATQVNRNLHFSCNMAESVGKADIVFISVNTPTKSYGLGEGRACDLTNLELVARFIASVSTKAKIIVEKSTVPVNAAQSIKNILQANSQPTGDNSTLRHQVLSNPEFLAEGSAIFDLQNPDRVLIGGDEQTVEGQRAIDTLRQLYLNWVPVEKILT